MEYAFPIVPAFNYCRSFVLIELSQNKTFNLANHPFILTFLSLLCESLSGFLEFIFHFQKKGKKCADKKDQLRKNTNLIEKVSNSVILQRTVISLY